MIQPVLAFWLMAAAAVRPADSVLVNGKILVFQGPERHQSA